MNPDITTTGCAIWLGDAATNMVSAAYDKYTTFASQAYTLATKELGDLQAFNIAPIQFSVSYNLDEAILDYVRPQAPAVPDGLAWQGPASIAPPPLVDVTIPTFDAAPGEPANPAPVLRDFTEPGELTATAPTLSLDLAPVTLPVRPDYELPPVPTLAELDLPDAPVLDIEDFTTPAPVIAVDAPLEDFSFTPEEYTSALLDKVSGRASAMLDGGTGLPASVANALRARAFATQDAQEFRAIDQAVDEFAARGFAEPSGVLARRLAEVRQTNQNTRAGLNRDVFIQEQQVEIENLRFAVTQSIALESALFQAHNEYSRVALEAAQVVQNLRIRVFEARVQLAQLNLSAYQTAAQVWRERLQGELAKVEIFRAQLSAVQVKGELNLQQVQVYEARLRGLNQLADLYRADIDAARLVVQTNQQQIDAERARIQNYAEMVNAYRATWDAYATKLGTNTLRANVYNLVEQGYATRLRAWSDAQGQKISQAQLGVSVSDLRQRSWRGQLDKVIADIQAETSRVNALSEVYRSQVGAYSAQATVETAASDANLRKLQWAAEQERNRTDVALRNAQIAISQMEEITRLMLSREQTIAQVSAQLASASMSAVNFSAGITSRRSEEQSCGTSFHYSGSLDDTPAT